MGRWIRFFIAILLGALGGLYYGWVINPVELVDTTPDTLRIDYKSDYVLMVAEVYQVDGNLEQAARRLTILGESDPLRSVQEALQYAQQSGYSETDKALLTNLLEGLRSWNPVGEGSAP